MRLVRFLLYALAAVAGLYVLDDAPNMFNLQLFYSDAVDAVMATTRDRGKLTPGNRLVRDPPRPSSIGNSAVELPGACRAQNLQLQQRA
jgi:hypothetical protein